MKNNLIRKIGCICMAAFMLFAQPVAAYCSYTHLQNSIEQTAQHPWQGKRIAFLGDSITDKRRVGTTRCYWEYLTDWLQLTPFVYAISGRQWNDIPHQAEQLKAEHGDDFDAIVVFIGTNDFNAGIPIGTWFTEQQTDVMAARHAQKQLTKRTKRTFCMDKDTYRGRINMALLTLKKMFPTKQIVLLTPLHRALAAFNDTNVQPTEAYQNSCGEYVDSYIQSVKEAGNLWAYPVIDLNALSGLYPLADEHAGYFHDAATDRLHPNAAGHQRMAKTLLYQLQSLPCTFD